MKTRTKLSIATIMFVVITIITPSPYELSATESTVASCEQLITSNDDRGLNYEKELIIPKQTITFDEPITKYVSQSTKVKDYKSSVTEETIYYWTATKVNFRKKPNINSDIIQTLEQRTKVEYIGEEGRWTKIKCGEEIGYVYSKYLTDRLVGSGEANRWGIALTYDEIELLAKIVWTEARGESDEGQIAVIECIFNRMISTTYPDSLYLVLSQKFKKYAFSSWTSRDEAKPTTKEYDNIYKVLCGETNIFDLNVFYFSTSPRNNNIVKKIDHHFFCKED